MEKSEKRKVYESSKRAHAKYQREKTKQLAVRFSPNDMYILDYIKGHENIAQYIKGLVLRDMEENGVAVG